MNDSMEDEVTRAFAAAAERAPTPAPDLARRIDAGVRRRDRRRRGQTLAVALTIVAVGGTAVAVPEVLSGAVGGLKGIVASGGGNGGGTELDLPKEKPPTLVPIEKLWPGAVHRAPGKLPNGRTYSPVTFVDGTTILAATESGFEKTDRLWLYDLATRKATPVTEIVNPKPVVKSDDRTYASDFTVGDGHVAWWTGYGKKGRGVIQIWAAPLRGGAAKKIGQLTAPEEKIEGGDVVGVARLAVARGKVVWSLASDRGGIYEVPLSGGTPRLVAGTQRHQIVSWPWIGKPNPGPMPPGRGMAGFSTIRNLESGQQRGVEPAPNINWDCGVTWCTGTREGKDSAPDQGLPAQRRDGSARRLVSIEPLSPESLPAYGRFIAIPVRAEPAAAPGSSEPPEPAKPWQPPKSFALYDLETGKAGDLGIKIKVEADNSFSVPGDIDPTQRIFLQEMPGGYLLVDLAAIK